MKQDQSTLSLENLPARKTQSEATLAKMRERLAEVRARINELTNGEVTPETVIELSSLRREAVSVAANIKAERIRWLRERYQAAASTAAIAAEHAAICANELQQLGITTQQHA